MVLLCGGARRGSVCAGHVNAWSLWCSLWLPAWLMAFRACIHAARSHCRSLRQHVGTQGRAVTRQHASCPLCEARPFFKSKEVSQCYSATHSGHASPHLATHPLTWHVLHLEYWFGRLPSHCNRPQVDPPHLVWCSAESKQVFVNRPFEEGAAAAALAPCDDTQARRLYGPHTKHIQARQSEGRLRLIVAAAPMRMPSTCGTDNQQQYNAAESLLPCYCNLQCCCRPLAHSQPRPLNAARQAEQCTWAGPRSGMRGTAKQNTQPNLNHCYTHHQVTSSCLAGRTILTEWRPPSGHSCTVSQGRTRIASPRCTQQRLRVRVPGLAWGQQSRNTGLP